MKDTVAHCKNRQTTMPKHRRKLPECPNCGHPFNEEENYCPVCGQENNEVNIPFHHFLLETIENTFHFDTKFFTTLNLLLFRPGRLTAEYNSGKRARFVPPVRMYVFISFVFFLLLSLQSGTEHTRIGYVQGGIATTKQDTVVSNNLNLTTALTREEMARIGQFTDKQLDSILVKAGSKPTKFNRTLERKVGKIIAGPSEFIHKIMKNSSIMMFFLMPFFAWIVYLMYRRKKPYYFECLVFSIHLHCFMFFLMSLSILAGFFTDSDIPGLTVFLLALAYLFLALRRVFMQRVLKTLLKTILLVLSYLVTLLIFLVLTFFVSILFY